MRLVHFVLSHLITRHVSCIPNTSRIEFFQIRNQGISDVIVPVFVDGIPNSDTRVVSICPNPVGVFFANLLIPAMILPIQPFILKQQTIFIGNVVPEIRSNTNTDTHHVPIQLLRMLNQKFLHPFLVPNQVTAIRVFEKALQSNICSTEDDFLSIQVKEFTFSGKIAHPELFCRFVGNAFVGFQSCSGHVEKGLVGRPVSKFLNRNFKLHFRQIIAFSSESSVFCSYNFS